MEFDDGDSGEVWPTLQSCSPWDPIKATSFCNTPVIREQGFSIGPILRQGWSAAASVTDRLTDTLYDYAPEEVSRSTVRVPKESRLTAVACMCVSVSGGVIPPVRPVTGMRQCPSVLRR